MEAFSWPRGDLSTMKHAMEPLVFISYRQADSSATAPWLADFDQAHFGCGATIKVGVERQTG
jgi:hypothetical protein